MRKKIRLSGKEVSGLAARVFGSAFLPSGAVGGASEAVEFLELTGEQGLERLDGEKDILIDTAWHAPEILAENELFAICDAGGSAAPFYAAALADWLAASLQTGGATTILLKGGLLQHYLAAIPYFLSGRGLAGMVINIEGDAVTLSASERSGASWRYVRLRSMPLSAVPLPEWLPRDAMNGVTTILCGFGSSPWPIDPFTMPAEDRFEIEGRDYSAMKTRILGTGWEIDAELWGSLMAFADRSLIKTSELSRLGAG